MNNTKKTKATDERTLEGKGFQVRVFNTFEESNLSDFIEMSKVPVQERIRNTVNLILRSYRVSREQLNLRTDKTSVTIIKSK